MKRQTIDQLTVGDTATFSKTIGESDVYLFSGITGDLNPAHLDEPYASQTKFGGRIVQGMLLASFIATVLANELPGPGTIYVSQHLDFKAPVMIGDTITARVEVRSIDKEKRRVTLAAEVRRSDGTVVLDGEAVVSPPRG
jgi:3-hydroxybutyryl-CoA dehydratase